MLDHYAISKHCIERFLPHSHAKHNIMSRKQSINSYTYDISSNYAKRSNDEKKQYRFHFKSFSVEKKCSFKSNKIIRPKIIKTISNNNFLFEISTLLANLRKLCHLRISESFKDYTH